MRWSILVFLVACGSNAGGGDAGTDGEVPDGAIDAADSSFDAGNESGGGTCVTSVAAGAAHTCAVKGDGTLWCWGSNIYGQLGDGSLLERDQPVMVAPLGNTVAEVGAGWWFTCARKTDATVWCWGFNQFSQVTGDGMTADSHVPTKVPIDSVAQIAVGSECACARKMDGTVWCWGDGEHGELGIGSTTSNPVAVTQVAAVGNVVDLAAGDRHTCVRKGDGSLWCWGMNDTGQLGVGMVGGGTGCTGMCFPSPVQVWSTSTAEVSLGGYHSCARKLDGTVWCWGANSRGQVGDNTSTDRPSPTQVNAFMDAGAAVFAGGNVTCARKADGSFWCWGDNDNGAVGDGTMMPRHAPVRITGLDGVTVASPSLQHNCASNGAMRCWGDNKEGQLGIGSTGGPSQCLDLSMNCQPTPVAPKGLCP